MRSPPPDRRMAARANGLPPRERPQCRLEGCAASDGPSCQDDRSNPRIGEPSTKPWERGQHRTGGWQATVQGAHMLGASRLARRPTYPNSVSPGGDERGGTHEGPLPTVRGGAPRPRGAIRCDRAGADRASGVGPEDQAAPEHRDPDREPQPPWCDVARGHGAAARRDARRGCGRGRAEPAPHGLAAVLDALPAALQGYEMTPVSH